MIKPEDLQIGRRVKGTICLRMADGSRPVQCFSGKIRSLAFGTTAGWHVSVRIDGTVTSPAGRTVNLVGVSEKNPNSTLELEN